MCGKQRIGLEHHVDRALVRRHLGHVRHLRSGFARRSGSRIRPACAAAWSCRSPRRRPARTSRPCKIRRLTLSTAVNAPNVLLMLSMTICGLASGSSQGRSAIDFGAAATLPRTPPAASRAVRSRRKEGTFDDLRSRHPTLPYEFPVQVDFRPNRRADLEMRRIDDSKGDVALASRRPDRRGDAADFPLAAVVGVQQRIVRGFVAGDVEADELAPRAALLLGEQRAPAGEMPLVEIHQPA